jgi:UDP-galactopyranose mutase
MENYDILVVGCGLSGIVIADKFAREQNKKVLIVDRRDHIGGNVYDYVDENGILMNKYGAHLFHTNDAEVWEYVNRYDEWVRWDHRVLGYVDGQYVPIPVNINTVNMLCGENIKDEEEMKEWLSRVQVKYDEITNSEEMGKSRVGEELYKKLFREYTYKQWNKYPEELDASVLARIPIRSNRDDRYFDDRYQGLPRRGYTEFCKKILEHENIEVRLNMDYFDVRDKIEAKIVIYTGPIDRYFSGCGYEELEYRSIDFVIERHKNMGYYQPNSVVNYPEVAEKYTRIVEYKHFLNQQSPHTTIVKEYTSDVGEPYYPVPNKRNMELYMKYRELIGEEEKKGVYFVGRLANYKYYNMDQAIRNALDVYAELVNRG